MCSGSSESNVEAPKSNNPLLNAILNKNFDNPIFKSQREANKQAKINDAKAEKQKEEEAKKDLEQRIAKTQKAFQNGPK